MFRVLSILLCLILSTRAACLLEKGDRVLVLGDSNTHSGLYAAALDMLIRTRLPDAGITLVTLGLGSETLSGTSEPDHPFPRPHLRERLDRALEKVQPTVVLFCYGMNDGLYSPPDAARLELFAQHARELAAKCTQCGARLIAVTPPPFDPASYKGALAAPDAAAFSYRAPWPDYNKTLARYAALLRDTPDLYEAVADIHTPLTAHLAAWRAGHPGWSSGDGIHPVPAIHWLMAGIIAETLELPPAVAEAVAAARGADGAWSMEIQAAPPLPAPPDAPDGFMAAAGFPRTMNRFTLTMPAAPAAAMRLLSEGRLLAVVTRDQLARGVDLAAYPALSLNRDAAAALPIALERHRLLSDAWRDHVGHTRPDTGRSKLPLPEAQAAAAPLEEKLAALLAVRTVTLRLETIQP